MLSVYAMKPTKQDDYGIISNPKKNNKNNRVVP